MTALKWTRGGVLSVKVDFTGHSSYGDFSATVSSPDSVLAVWKAPAVVAFSRPLGLDEAEVALRTVRPLVAVVEALAHEAQEPEPQRSACLDSERLDSEEDS